LAKPVQLSEVIGGYALERVLGRGGMGTVFLGKHRLLGRAAAVKVLDAEMAGNEQLVSRFFHEAKIVNDVRHPNIVDVIDFVRTENPRRVAFIMEYLEGDSLDRFLKERGALPVAHAINVVIQILDGLSAVHAIGVIHRDLKPANLRFTTQALGDCSAVPILKILDFGIAKASGPMVAHKTQTGLVMGTPAYMAPEQVSGEVVSPASDVYAVGEIFYELLGGKRMFSGTNTEVLRAKLATQPPPLDLPEGLARGDDLLELIRSSIAFDPAERPSTQAMIAELRALRSKVGAAVPHDFEEPLKPTTMVPVPARTPAPTPRTPAPPSPRTPAPMNTLAADRSLVGVTSSPSRPILPIAIGIAFLVAAGAIWLVAMRQQEEPIVVHSLPDPPPPPVAAVVAEPPAAEPEPPPAEPEPEPKKKKRKKEPRVRAKRAIAREPAPPKERDVAPAPTFGRIKVTAWTTAGRQVPATVKIDGKKVDRAAPLEIKARTGKRKIEIEAVGHPPKTQEVVVVEGETATIDVVVDLR
jgi:serine/threonine-protein kinase